MRPSCPPKQRPTARTRALVSKDCPSMITALRRLFGSTLGKFFALAFVLLVGLAFALGDVTGSGSFGGVGGANVARVGSSEIGLRSEEHTSELQSLMSISYAVFCLKKKNTNK